MIHSLIIVIVNALWLFVIVTLMKWSHESRSHLRNVINERNKELHNVKREAESMELQLDAQADLADKRQATIWQRDATIRARDEKIKELDDENTSLHQQSSALLKEIAGLKEEYAEYRKESGNAIQALTKQLDELKDRHSRLLEFHERLRASAHKALVELRSELEN